MIVWMELFFPHVWTLTVKTLVPHNSSQSGLGKYSNGSSQEMMVFQLNELKLMLHKQLEVRAVQLCLVPEEHYHDNDEAESWAISPHQHYCSLTNFPKVQNTIFSCFQKFLKTDMLYYPYYPCY